MRWANIVCLFRVDLACVLCFLAAGYHSSVAASEYTTEAHVDDEPITTPELNLQVSLVRSQVLNSFREKFGTDITSQKDFWTNNYGGEVPAQQARQLALQKLKGIKVQELLAYHKGLLTDIHYETFISNLAAENKKRDSIIASHGAIYGLVHYTEETFYDYVFTNMQADLQKNLAEHELKPSEQQLQEYYYAIRDSHFKSSNSIYTQLFKISYAYPDTQKNVPRDTAWKLARKAQKKLREGTNLAAIQQSMNGGFSQRIFNDSTARFDHTHDREVLNAAETLSIGSVSDVVDDGYALTVLKCIDRKINGYRPYEQVAAIVRAKYIEIAYENYIDSLTQTAKLSEASPKIGFDVSTPRH